MRMNVTLLLLRHFREKLRDPRTPVSHFQFRFVKGRPELLDSRNGRAMGLEELMIESVRSAMHKWLPGPGRHLRILSVRPHGYGAPTAASQSSHVPRAMGSNSFVATPALKLVPIAQRGLRIEYYRSGQLVAVDTDIHSVSSAQQDTLRGISHHRADTAKIRDGRDVVAIFHG